MNVLVVGNVLFFRGAYHSTGAVSAVTRDQIKVITVGPPQPPPERPGMVILSVELAKSYAVDVQTSIAQANHVVRWFAGVDVPPSEILAILDPAAQAIAYEAWLKEK